MATIPTPPDPTRPTFAIVTWFGECARYFGFASVLDMFACNIEAYLGPCSSDNARQKAEYRNQKESLFRDLDSFITV